ncbi:zinc finger protein 385D [Clarias gariepinus]|uniref:zinc finger protein 385D n=1 Tax=Clarias gariepinus TaxID=13013 RepID=UPI00234D5B9D|nr:zinc finger protein 385D [Clarias gariepinus]
MESSMFLSSVCQGGLVPALVRAPLPQVHSSVGLKHFLPFSLETSPALNLLPTFASMDPVQKAVLHHTLGISPLSKRKHVSCNVCQLRFNSQSQALSHYKGTKHAKKLKSLEVPKCKQKSSAVMRENRKEPEKNLSPSAPLSTTEIKEAIPDPLQPAISPSPAKCGSSMASPEAEFTSTEGQSPDLPPGAAQDPEAEKETEEEKALRLLYCSLCKVAVNSASQLEAHNSGTKHKTMLEARNGNGSIKSFPRPGVKNKLLSPSAASTGLQNKTFHCETCDVRVNSETQLKQHISSRRHKDRAAGKPAKPKYSPYTKTPKGQTKQQTGKTPVKLPLSKDMGQTLTAAIVPSHLAAVAAAAAGFPLRASHNPSLFQTQSLPTTLLRPAPGPIRTSHTPVLFAPY